MSVVTRREGSCVLKSKYTQEDIRSKTVTRENILDIENLCLSVLDVIKGHTQR